MRQERDGFTIVEVLITIALLVVLTAVAGVNLHAYTMNRNLKSAARDIIADFSLYKRKAVTESESYKITFHVAESKYTVQRGNTVVATKYISTYGKGIELVSAQFGAGKTVHFLTRGIVSPFGNVILKNSRQSQATIKVNITGKTYVAFDIK